MQELFNIVKKGYDQDEVDNYIMTLEALIKSYKDKDDTIKNAIINAQIAADNIIKNAEIEGDRIKKRAIRLLAEIQTSIESQKRIARDFQEEYNRLANKYLQNIGNSEIEKLVGKIVELEDYVASMQRTHDSIPQAAAPVTPGELVPKVATQITNPAPSIEPPQPIEKINVEDNETVALVAELLAKDKSRN